MIHPLALARAPPTPKPAEAPKPTPRSAKVAPLPNFLRFEERNFKITKMAVSIKIAAVEVANALKVIAIGMGSPDALLDLFGAEFEAAISSEASDEKVRAFLRGGLIDMGFCIRMAGYFGSVSG